jgi:uncharacterized oxidoreductase
MKLAGNTVLITGGATGIGLALAEAFAQAGSQVAICGRREARLREAQQRIPGLQVRRCDVASPAECQELARWAAVTLPGLNVLVNNAGIQRDLDFTTGADDFVTGPSEIRINLDAPILLAGLFVPILRGKPDPVIINVSSGLGFVPAAKMPVYSATKAGLHAFSLALRFQLAKVGIEVVEVVPPAVDTELNQEGRAARGGWKAGLAAEEFVGAVMKALAAGTPEIGYGFSAGHLKASRAELDEAFKRMNSHW